MTRKFKIIVIVILNILFLLLGGGYILSIHQNDFIATEIPLYNWGGKVEKNDNLYKTSYPISKYWFLVETGKLKEGVYQVRVYYKAKGDAFYLYCDSERDRHSYPVVYADDYILSENKEELSFKIWINNPIDCLKVHIECGKNNVDTDRSLYIDNIEIIRNYRASVQWLLIRLLVGLFLLDGMAVIYLNYKKIQKDFYVIFAIMGIFIVSSLGILNNYQNLGHDMVFHYGRIIGLAEGLSSGQFPVRIQPGWNNNYGYATSVFYGDILLYVPAILYIFHVPIIYAYKVYVILINLGTVGISYYCFKNISKDKYIGVAATALYCLSINRILNIYLRAAVGEYSAFMFLPLVLLGLLRILAIDKENIDKKAWVFLCLGMTGIIQTHVLSFEMVCIFIAVIVIISFKKILQREILIEFCKSILVTICLNLNFLLPFLDCANQDLLVFAKKTDYGIQGLGLSLYELFSINSTASGQALLSILGLRDRFPESLGMVFVFFLTITIVLLFKYDKMKKGEKKNILISFCMAALALFMSTYHFPWNRLAGIPIFSNIVSSIQFPWRFVSIAIPILTYMICMVLKILKRQLRKEYYNFFLVGICIICTIQALVCMDIIMRSSNNYVKYDGSVILNEKETVSGGEYLLEGTSLTLALLDSNVKEKNVEISNILRKGNEIELNCKAGNSGYIEIPLFQYKYYRCIDKNTKENFLITRGENNKIRVDLPENYYGTLKVFFKEPWYWRVAEIISLLTAISIIVFLRKNTIKFSKNMSK